MSVFKRSPSLTEQVRLYLRQRIINKEFDDGRIPAEQDLAGELNVSRNTIRDALGRLEAEGVIFRRQGAGTFINQAGLLVKTRLEEIIPYETLIKEHGYIPTIILSEVVEEPAPAELSVTLNLEPSSPILVIKKLFLADENPVICNLIYLPLKLIKQPYTTDDLPIPVPQLLLSFCQETFSYYLSEIIPLIASPWLVENLALPQAHTAILSFEEVGYNQDNIPVVKTCSYFRNDLLHLRLIRR